MSLEFLTSAFGSLPRQVRTVLGSVAIATALLSLGSLVPFGAKAAASVAMGGLLAFTNLWALSRIVATLMPDSSQISGRATTLTWSIVGAVKVAALVAILYYLLGARFVSPVALLCGLGSLPIGIAIGSMVRDRNEVKDD